MTVWHPVYLRVTVTPAKVPVTLAASGKIPWQAGMSSLISHVRGYVPVTGNEARGNREFLNDKAGKGEKHQ